MPRLWERGAGLPPSQAAQGTGESAERFAGLAFAVGTTGGLPSERPALLGRPGLVGQPGTLELAAGLNRNGCQ